MYLQSWLIVDSWLCSVSSLYRGQRGSILTGIILSIVTIVVLAALIPALWPLFVGSIADINALNGTDTATMFLKTGWPVAILIIGIGIVVALIYFALKQFGLVGGGGKGRGRGRGIGI